MAGQIDHPILITECVCNPVYSRSKMAELLFETYGVPSVGMTLVSSAFDCLLLKQMFDITLLLTQHLEWMLLSATSTINDMGNVKKMELLSVLASLQHTPFRYVCYAAFENPVGNHRKDFFQYTAERAAELADELVE